MLLHREQWPIWRVPFRYHQIDHIPAHLLNKLPRKKYQNLSMLFRILLKYFILSRKKIVESAHFSEFAFDV